MKAEELRLGNILNSNDYPFIVEHRDFTNFYVNGMGNLTGMKLTPEWLEKFGFYETLKGDHNYWRKTVNENLRFEIVDRDELGEGKWIGNFYFDDWLELVKLNYVHQLQNLYFVLCNQELTSQK